MVIVVQISGPRQVTLASYPPRPLPPGHVRVRTRYSGISAGTELTAYRGTNPYLTRAWDPATRLFTDRTADFDPEPPPGAPTHPDVGWGYSEAGVVVEAAPDVSAPNIGDQVWGRWGHRSEAVIPAERLAGHTVPAGVDLLAATFARIGATALNAVLAADVHLGELVAVFGQGVVGLLATRLATLSGATVAAVDPLAPRREMAIRYGATAALSPQGAAEEIRRLGAGGGAALLADGAFAGADVAIELSGAYPAVHEAIRSVGVGGRVVAAGFYQGDGVGLRLGEEFHHNRVHLVPAQIGGMPAALAPRWDYERLQRVFLGQVATRAVDVAGLVSHVLPVARAADAYDLLDRHPADALQVILEFG